MTSGAIIIAIILYWFFRDLIREIVIMPATYFLWLTKMIFESFNQQAIWISLIIVATIIIFSTLSPISERQRKKHTDSYEPLNRVAQWANRLHDIDRGDYLKWRLAQHLSKLTIETLAYRNGMTVEQVTKELEIGNLYTTPKIHSYLKAAHNSKQIPTSQNHILKKKKTSFLDLDIEHLITYLEKLLES